MKEILPELVFTSIQQHLMRASHRAESGFPSCEEDEDCLTGDLFRSLRRTWTKSIRVDGTNWRWRFTTRKFRGRGELATESLIGADGILQIEISGSVGAIAKKGMLFQAKKNWRNRSQILINQIGLMEEYAPGGSSVFNFTAEGYTAFPSSAVLEQDGRPGHHQRAGLGEFLAKEFLGCFVGRPDTYYDWDRKRLLLSGSDMGLFRLHTKFVGAIEVEETRE
jgi:hypothetical protein